MTISTVIPDTITSWIASAFAVNSVSGLGVASSNAKASKERKLHFRQRIFAYLQVVKCY